MKNFEPPAVISKINAFLQDLLQENLVGIYYHGSVAMGCFHPKNSDLDFIVLIEEKIPYETKVSIIDFLLEHEAEAPHKGFEMSVVLQEFSKNFIYPTPYELHYSNDHKQKYRKDKNSLCNDKEKTDADLAAHFTIIRHTDPIVFGKPVKDVFGLVDRQYYVDSIYQDILYAQENIMEDAVYTTLNLCRVLAYLKDGLILSKEQGGQWGLKNLETGYHDLIEQCLGQYNNCTPVFAGQEIKRRFAGEMLKRIVSYKQ